MTTVERLTNAIKLNTRLVELQRQVSALQQDAIDELKAAKQEAERRVDDMPTNLQPDRAGVQ